MLQFLWIGFASLAIAGCKPAIQPTSTTPSFRSGERAVSDSLVQFSLVAALATGDYAGGTPLSQMLSSGDFGVGTFSRLDGEMILLDGKVYQALADGKVRVADLDDTTPFAAVKFFREDGRLDNLAAASLDDLDAQLDRQLPRRNLPCAIRVEADCQRLTLRSVPPQSPPFLPLVEVIKQQVTHDYRNIRGTLVGLRCPHWVGTLNVAGYHWHFLSEDRALGGHVLNCEFTGGTLRFDESASLVIHLPNTREFEQFDAEGIKQQDIDRIERQRGDLMIKSTRPRDPLPIPPSTAAGRSDR